MHLVSARPNHCLVALFGFTDTGENNMTHEKRMKWLAISLVTFLWSYAVYSMLSRPEARFNGYLLLINVLAVILTVGITKVGQTKATLEDFCSWVCSGVAVWLFFRIVLAGESNLQGIVATIGSILVSVYFARERIRLRKAEYLVGFAGRPDDEGIVYHESKQAVIFCYSRKTKTMFIPTDRIWQTKMPYWSRDRKSEIVARVKLHFGKRLFGKPITFVETDSDEFIASQVDSYEHPALRWIR